MPQLNTLTYLAILLLGGLFFGRLAKLIHLPNVTGYLVGGLLLGPSVLNVIPHEALVEFELISEMALAIAGKVVGRELSDADQSRLVDSFIEELGDQV